MSERKNVYISFTSSLVIHVFLCIFYLYLSQARKTNMIFLENIELIEIEPDIPIIQEMPRQAQIPPKSVIDFIKMALPVFKKPKPQEVIEPEIDSKILKKAPEKISLDKTLKTRSKQQISLTKKKYEKSEKLSEIIPKTEIDKKDKFAMIAPQKPDIDLAEVGKVAVGKTSLSQPISLKKKTLASLKKIKDLKQVRIVKAKDSSYSYKPQTLKKTGISIAKRRHTTVSKPSLGYGKGISLTRQIRKPSEKLKISQPITKKVEKTSAGMIRKAKPDKKSIQISGQVVGRKILASYLPVYPDWARVKNIEADVVIRFYVSFQGIVREKLYLERTSGYSKLDQLAMESLKKWVFEPLKTTAGDQWGIITFRYLLE